MPGTVSATGHRRGRVGCGRAPGLRPVPSRLCLQGILYVLHNDIAWQLLPLELGSARARAAGGGWSGGRRGRASHHRGPGHGNAVTGAQDQLPRKVPPAASSGTGTRSGRASGRTAGAPPVPGLPDRS
ncbi:transposase [Streptomyces piniterrae]|uniref:Transposase n=1 Tax=Streptomyces piniterrae TaxID=2571125 RepID=A0A4U0NK23_9ACTN|nr:transposase [Streptomyces piniterrae]